jgi:hypothetical protein
MAAHERKIVLAIKNASESAEFPRDVWRQMPRGIFPGRAASAFGAYYRKSMKTSPPSECAAAGSNYSSVRSFVRSLARKPWLFRRRRLIRRLRF